ncbi:MAG: hypothetical protein H6637_07760 [Ardenticatenales bacterium]|nr:hypothetical protein [Ardenticatenales bacterium]
MATRLTDAIEGADYPLTITVTNPAGGAVTPASASWSLTDLQGNTINSRADVALTPAASMPLVLQESDLDIPAGYDFADRVLRIVGTYDDPTYGAGVSFLQVFSFRVVRPGAGV